MLIARMALLAWIPLSVLMGGFLRAPQAVAVILFGGVMLLPTRIGWDFPGLPALGRAEIASICSLAVVLLFQSGRLSHARFSRGIDWLILASFGGVLVTTLGNRDPVFQGSVKLPGLSLYDAPSEIFPDLLYVVVPLVVCRVMVRSTAEFRLFLRVFLGAMVLYTVLVLVELRFSPQLHRWTYGFHPHAFHQHMRYGGFRPMVFLGSGLIVSFFLATATILAAEFSRSRRALFGMPAIAVCGWLWVVLVASKSLASLIYGTLGAAAVLFLSPRWQIRAALVISILAVSYGPLRIAGALSTDGILAVASVVSEDRADSLEFRFRNEDALVERAMQRPYFGWGGFRRSMIFDQWGDMKSIVDGHWIIALGRRGLVGMALGFAILLAPIVIAYRRFHLVRRPDDRRLIAAATLVLSFALVDLQPNAMFTYLPYMFGGALIGTVDGLTSGAARKSARRRKRAVRSGNAGSRETPAVPPQASPAPAAAATATVASADAGASLGAARRDSRHS